MNLQSTDFELFDIPAQFAQDRHLIDTKWKDLQRQAHPDKFMLYGAAAQRIAMQWSVRINEAYARLKDPLKRASYLCELNGAPINAHTNTAMPTDFMMMQIEWREALEDAKSFEDLDKIELETANYQRIVLSKIEQYIDVEHDFLAAANAVRSLMFVARFVGEIEARQDQI
ncbi:MAG TPA: Fe-S protein assembly co-chaperone HscB [Burkholderiaceae bacterium]|nr:Fe-S protein assembly co-chaperone HscB [Burkholderiaceae bacterium]